MADQQPRPHRAGPRSLAGVQAAVNADRARHGLPEPGKRERHHAAEAEADRGDPAVGIRAARQGGQARPCPADHERRIIPQRPEAVGNTVPVAGRADTEHVAGENRVPECRVSPCLLAGVFIEAGAPVDEQQTRSRAG